MTDDTEQIKQPKYVFLLSVPTVGDVDGVILNDVSIPFQIMSVRDKEHLYYLALLDTSDDLIPFEVMSKAWLKFRMHFLAYDYDDFVKTYDDPKHIPTNLYKEQYPTVESKEE